MWIKKSKYANFILLIPLIIFIFPFKSFCQGEFPELREKFQIGFRGYINYSAIKKIQLSQDYYTLSPILTNGFSAFINFPIHQSNYVGIEFKKSCEAADLPQKMRVIEDILELPLFIGRSMERKDFKLDVAFGPQVSMVSSSSQRYYSYNDTLPAQYIQSINGGVLIKLGVVVEGIINLNWLNSPDLKNQITVLCGLRMTNDISTLIPNSNTRVYLFKTYSVFIGLKLKRRG